MSLFESIATIKKMFNLKEKATAIPQLNVEWRFFL